jgi:hypothetical protein
MSRYHVAHDGEWIKPRMRGYRLACCGCGLVHVVDFVVAKYRGKHIVLFRAFRDERATAAKRRVKRGLL